MLMRRKEAKSYGTKKVIEGHYKSGEKCVIVEDVVTSGSSVLETVRDLRNEGLIAEKAVIILDREQGGKQNLEANNVKITSLFTMNMFIDILIKNNCIKEQIGNEAKNYFKTIQAPSIGESLNTHNFFIIQLNNIIQFNTIKSLKYLLYTLKLIIP